MSLRAKTQAGFQSLLRIARSSIAEPPWFATPVEAMEDAGSFTIVFHAPVKTREIAVAGAERSVTLMGPRSGHRSRATRLCTFPCPIVPDQIEAARSGDLLRIRIPKRIVDRVA